MAPECLMSTGSIVMQRMDRRDHRWLSKMPVTFSCLNQAPCGKEEAEGVVCLISVSSI